MTIGGKPTSARTKMPAFRTPPGYPSAHDTAWPNLYKTRHASSGCLEISSRSRRLRPQSSRPALAGRRAHRRPVRGELRGRWRAQYPAWRRHFGSLSIRRAWRATVAWTAPHECRIDVRIRLARGILAALAAVHEPQGAGDRLRCRDRARSLPGCGGGDARSALGDREPRPQMDRL